MVYCAPITLTANELSAIVSRIISDSVHNPDTGCMEMRRHLNREGYCHLSFKGKKYFAHRLVLEHFSGPIGTLVSDHLCKNHACVNPKHLDPVTAAENTRRWAAEILVCKQGHPFDTENTYRWRDGRRDCRKCIATRVKNYQARKAAAAIVGAAA